jgi:hypothetical protein
MGCGLEVLCKRLLDNRMHLIDGDEEGEAGCALRLGWAWYA